MQSSSSVPVETRLRDLRATVSPVSILGRIVALQRREVVRRTDGGRRPVLTGLLSDGTATVRFTWWDPPTTDEIDRGTVLRATNVQVREFRGRPELSFNFRTRVGPASDADLPQVGADEFPPKAVRELRTGDEGFSLEARVVRVAPREVTVGTERKQLHEGLLSDATGTIAFTSWTDFRLAAGEAVRIIGGYVRSFRNRPQLNLDDRSRVERIDRPSLPSAEEALGPRAPRWISALESEGGGEVVSFVGTVVGLIPPSGVVYRCPNCRRLVQKGLCRVHGAVEAAPDLRARLVIDDGSGAATVNLERVATEKLWDVSLEGALERLRQQPDPSLVEEQLFGSLLGRRLSVQGRGSTDDFGLAVYPGAITEAPLDRRPVLEKARVVLGGST